ncbi:DUF6522 family protein [Roseovarius amoyensis]|uniref:DUF6522 family protein n=1 Tax=Roseovarius amoyensis TaxID=2211448 RepID=UPI000DBE90F5|nr:DUF6522 family protein [Roseovarius amoyensis]
MNAVTRDGDGFVVDAALLAEIFGLSEAGVRRGMRDGAITSRCETGTGSDAGRWRLTFTHGGRTCRLTVDEHGKVLFRASYDVSRRPARGVAGT